MSKLIRSAVVLVALVAGSSVAFAEEQSGNDCGPGYPSGSYTTYPGGK